MIKINDAIDAFISSFCVVRSVTYPYSFERIGDLIVMRDTPPRKTDGRNTEIAVIPGVSPEDAVSQLNKINIEGRITLCPFCDMQSNAREMAKQYKTLGFRVSVIEPLMAFDLSQPIPAESKHDIKLVQTKTEADMVKKLARSRILSSNLDITIGGTVRTYYMARDGQAVAWCRSVVAHPAASYVSGMHTAPEYRRQGIGKALLAAMAAGDAESGLKHTVLLASHAGSLLYTSFGYEHIGSLIVMTPKR